MSKKYRIIKNEVFSIPAEYQELEYIKNTGNHAVCRIPTNIQWKDITSISSIISVESFNASSGAATFYGTDRDSGTFIICKNDNTFIIGGISGFSGSIDNNKFNATFTSTYTDYFTVKQWNDNYFSGVVKWGEIKLYNGTDLIQHLIPAKRKSDSAIGLYDKVSEQFFPNIGTRAYSSGSEVHRVKEALTMTKYTSPNLFNIGVWTNTSGCFVDKDVSKGSMRITYNGNVVRGQQTLSELAPGLEVGKTYYLLGESTHSTRKYLYDIAFSAITGAWFFNSSITITQEMLDCNPGVPSDGNTVISQLMIVEGTSKPIFEPYGTVNKYQVIMNEEA